MTTLMTPLAPDAAGDCGGSVGLIGAGLMGLAMTERLRSRGREVLGWDISVDQRSALARLGGAVAGDSSEVFSRCRRIILSLPNDEVVAGVLTEAGGAMRAGQVVMDTSTGAPEAAASRDRELGARGVGYLDATVSGSSAQTRSGEIVMMVGGSPEAFAECRELFGLLARQAIHTGPCGSGAKMKLVTNLVLGLNRAALAEGLLLARALGLPDDQALRVLRESMAFSRVMESKGEKMVRGDFAPQARLSQHLKDVCLMLEAGAATGVPLPLTAVHRDLLEFGERHGLGPLDNAAIIRAIELLKGGEPVR